MTKSRKQLINDICREEGGCKDSQYCLLKELMLHDAKYSGRMLTQMALIDKYKYELSFEAGKDLGWSESFAKWVETGKAKLFDKYFNEDISLTELYKKIINDKQ